MSPRLTLLLLPPQDQEGVELLEGSFYDGDLYCKVNHVAKIAVQDKEYDLNNNEYHLLLAAGSALKRKLWIPRNTCSYLKRKTRYRKLS